VRFDAGDVLFVPAGVPHRFASFSASSRPGPVLRPQGGVQSASAVLAHHQLQPRPDIRHRADLHIDEIAARALDRMTPSVTSSDFRGLLVQLTRACRPTSSLSAPQKLVEFGRAGDEEVHEVGTAFGGLAANFAAMRAGAIVLRRIDGVERHAGLMPSLSVRDLVE